MEIKNVLLERQHLLPIAIRTLSVLVPMTVIIVGFTLFFYHTQRENELRIHHMNEKSHVDLAIKVIGDNFDAIISDLLILAEHRPLQQYLQSDNAKCLKHLEDAFFLFSRRKRIYDQIRYIDNQGVEIVRINYNNGHPAVVPQDRLQNKYKRYYFMDTYVLQRNQVFVSPFDLNIENGEIEHPFKPMIRFGTPVFDQNNQKRGVVILNYLGDHLLQKVEDLASGFNCEYAILDSKSYFIKSFQRDREWGFMFDGGKDWTLDRQYPELGDAIKERFEGQVQNEHGLFTYKRIFPIKQSDVISGSDGGPLESTEIAHLGEAYYWVILTRLSNEQIYHKTDLLLKRSLILNTGVIFFLAIGLWFVSAIKYREMYEQMTHCSIVNVELQKTNQKVVQLHKEILSYNEKLEKKNSVLQQEIVERKKAEERLQEFSEKLEDIVKQRSRELEKAQEQLVRKEKLATLGQLAGGVGHELRNPLTVINNALYVLKMTIPDTNEMGKEYVDIIESEIKNAEKIVADLLDFARIKTVEKTRIDVASLIDDVLKKAPPPENIHVSVDMDHPGLEIFGDSQKITQVLLNLVTNAYQAMPKGGDLVLSGERIDGKIRLEVRDTGAGIPEENVDKIFEPLFTTKAKGIGLGLSVSRNLIEANGGALTVQSTIGRGSSFVISLPASASE